MLIIAVVAFGAALSWALVQLCESRRSAKILEHVEEENKKLKDERVRAVIEAQERERREIGQDMHDELGSTLLTMKLNLGLIEKQGLFIFESNEALKELKYTMDNAIEYVKGVSRITSPAFLENFGLSRALLQMVKRINSSCVAKVEFEEVGDEQPLDKDKQLHVFRIIQEVTNNALRYASPWRITVTFYWNADSFTVDIWDDGYNYRLMEKRQAAGMGLNNIMNRAKLIGGTFTSVEVEEGNLVKLQLPYTSEVVQKVTQQNG